MHDLSVPGEALWLLTHEAACLDSREHSVHMRDMFLVHLQVDGCVIDVHATEATGNAVGERRVHRAVEHCGCVDETSRHRSAPKEAVVRDEDRLVAPIGRGGYLPKSRVQVETREKSVVRGDLGQIARLLTAHRHRISARYRALAELAKVYAHVVLSRTVKAILLDTERWRAPFRRVVIGALGHSRIECDSTLLRDGVAFFRQSSAALGS